MKKTKKWLWAEKYFLKKEFFSLKFQLPLCDRIFQKILRKIFEIYKKKIYDYLKSPMLKLIN